MSKKARVKMAKILVGAGFSPRKVLKLVGYPNCRSIIHVADTPTPSIKTIRVVVDDGRIEYQLASSGRGQELNPPAIPYLDDIEQTGDNVYGFYYANKTQRKIIAKGNLTIPPAPGWPEIDFLPPKYPVPI